MRFCASIMITNDDDDNNDNNNNNNNNNNNKNFSTVKVCFFNYGYPINEHKSIERNFP